MSLPRGRAITQLVTGKVTILTRVVPRNVLMLGAGVYESTSLTDVQGPRSEGQFNGSLQASVFANVGGTLLVVYPQSPNAFV